MALFGLMPDHPVRPDYHPMDEIMPGGFPPTMPQQTPVPSAGGGGILEWLGSSMGAGDASSTGLNRLGYLGAALQDAGDGGRGQRVSQFMQRSQQEGIRNKRDQANQKIQQAFASGDMNKVRQALAELAASDPEAVSHVTQALGFGAPKFQEAGGGIYQIPGVMDDGPPKQVVAPRAERPMTANGMISYDNGQTWQPISGYVDQQREIAGARRAPPRAPTNGVIALPHPGSMY